jgi:hypothetical protein
VAVSSEQRVVVAREVRGPGLPPGSEMAVGGWHELLLKLLELSTAGLLSGLVATICEEEEAMGGAWTSPRPTNSVSSHR